MRVAVVLLHGVCVCLSRVAAVTVTGFRESNRVVNPSVGAFDLILRRSGNLALLSRVRVVSRNFTVDGFVALPGVHYSVPTLEEGYWLQFPPGIAEQVLQITIFRQAQLDLERTWRASGVMDSKIQFQLELVEGVNTLLPESWDAGIVVTVEITLQGRTVPVSRLGEPTAAAIAVAVCVAVLVCTLVVRHYIRSQRERRCEWLKGGRVWKGLAEGCHAVCMPARARRCLCIYVWVGQCVPGRNLLAFFSGQIRGARPTCGASRKRRSSGRTGPGLGGDGPEGRPQPQLCCHLLSPPSSRQQGPQGWF
jgi:hypothetical protein